MTHTLSLKRISVWSQLRKVEMSGIQIENHGQSNIKMLLLMPTAVGPWIDLTKMVWTMKKQRERESSSDSASTYQDGHEHEEERSDAMSGNEDHSEGIGMPIDFDEEECVKVRHRVVQVDPRRLWSRAESPSSGELGVPPTRLSAHMKIPVNASEGSKGLVTTETADGENSYDGNGKSGGASKVCVRVLVKKGHKQQMKQMLIPGDCSLVNTKQEAIAEIEEKQNIKRIVLEYNEREEELNRESLQAGGRIKEEAAV
jgi:regulator of nonsense transcripts 2